MTRKVGARGAPGPCYTIPCPPKPRKATIKCEVKKVDEAAANLRIAREIMGLLEKNRCTIAQAEEISRIVKETICETTTVQFDGHFPYN